MGMYFRLWRFVVNTRTDIISKVDRLIQESDHAVLQCVFDEWVVFTEEAANVKEQQRLAQRIRNTLRKLSTAFGLWRSALEAREAMLTTEEGQERPEQVVQPTEQQHVEQQAQQQPVQPAVQPTEQQVVQQAQQPLVQPAPQPVVQEAMQPPVQPAVQPAAQPALWSPIRNQPKTAENSSENGVREHKFKM